MTITNEPGTQLKDGRVVTVAGPVVDVEFPADGGGVSTGCWHIASAVVLQV